MKSGGRQSGKEIWEMIRTAQIAKRGHISHKQNSLISHPSSSTFIDLQYLLDLAFQIGLLLVTITVKH